MQIPTGDNYHTTTNKRIVAVLCGNNMQRNFTIKSIEKRKREMKIIVW
jgi:hypothetical protein